MAAWKIAPALACGNTVVLKPAETTPLTALQARRAHAGRRTAAGRGQHHHRRGRHGRGARQSSGHRQDRLHRLHRGGQAHPAKASPAPARSYTLELGGKAANIIFADAAIDQAVEGIVNGIYFNQGHVCCAGSRLFVQESVADEVIAKLKDRMQTLIVGDPLDKNTDIGAINSDAQLEKIEDYLQIGQAEGAEMYQSSRCACPRKATGAGRRCSPACRNRNRVVAGRDLRAGARHPDLPHRPRKRWRRPTTRPTGSRGGVWTDKGAKIFKMTQQHPRRRHLGQHLQQVRSHLALRRLQGKRHGPRRRLAWALSLRGAALMAARAKRSKAAKERKPSAPIDRGARSRASRGGNGAARVPVAKTYKLYIDGKFPRSESGRYYVVNDSRDRLIANICRSSRKDFRDAVVAARGAFASWSGASAYLRGQILYRIAEMLEGRREQFVAELDAAGHRTPRRGRRGDGEHRPAGLLRRLGRQVPADLQQRQSGELFALQFLGAGTDGRRGGHRSGVERPSGPGLERCARDRRRQHLRGARLASHCR